MTRTALTPRGLVVDLTRAPLGPETPVYPGDPPIVFEEYASLERQGFYARRICIGEHVGTHIDAPAHFIERGAGIDEVPLERLVAPAVAVDLSQGGGPAGRAELEEALAACGWRPGVLQGSWLIARIGSRRLTGEAAEALTAWGAVGLGVDAESPDEPPYPVHRVLLAAGAPIIENLKVPDLLLCRGFLLVAAPLPLRGGSGSPARVYALL